MELRDLVTQKSVIQRANMAAVMRNYRDDVVLTVERKSCLAAELRISHASEDLLWAISVLEGLHMAISESIERGQYMCLTKLTLKRH
jgi:ketosteroid isomerase-like protein